MMKGKTTNLFFISIQKMKRFTYSEVEAMTNNFERVLGEGGLGVVSIMHGSLDDTKHLAVKLANSIIYTIKDISNSKQR